MRKRTADEDLRILSRRSKVAALVLQGVTNQYEIAERLGMDRDSGQRTVSRDLKALREQWREMAVANWCEAKGKELARLDRIEAEAWAAWERSKVDRTSTRAKEKKFGRSKSSESEIKREKRDGDPCWLEVVADCVRQRRAILGLDAPTKVAPTSPDGSKEYGKLSDDERSDAFAQLCARLGRRPGGAAGAGQAAAD